MSTHSHRTAKAWIARPDWADRGDVYFAPTASKARYACKQQLSDVCEIGFHEIIVRRAKDHDILLPAPHRIVAELSEAEREIVMHAFGSGTAKTAGYRDHYCTAPGDGRLLRLAWELGIFRGPYGEREYGDSGIWSGVFFYLTEFGRHVALSMLPTYGGSDA